MLYRGRVAYSSAAALFMASTLRLIPTERFSVWCLEQRVQLPLPLPGTTRYGVTVVKAYRLPSPCEGIFVVSSGSVVDFSGDAIVNAANRVCLGGGGVDGAITARGGPTMAAERQNLPILEGTHRDRCATGDAKITSGGGLPAKKCIHSVGPNYNLYRNLADADELLTSAYRRSVAVARDSGEVKTLAFSLLSAGVFRGARSLHEVLLRGVRGVVQEACGSDKEGSPPFPALDEVHLVAFTKEEMETLVAVADKVFLGNEC
jgi:O-acetyl-ADP-ribose deacetylase (regulator of RNase III)